MSDKKAILAATCDKGGRVVCPVCLFKIPVPDDKSLSQGLGVCPNGHRFLVNGECVAAFHHFLRKTRSAAGQHSHQMIQNAEDTPKIMKDIQDQISEGEVIKP